MIERFQIVSGRKGKGGQAKTLLWSDKRVFGTGLNKNTIVIILLAILLGRASILDGLAPFGIAFYAAMISREKGHGYLTFFIMAGVLSAQHAAEWLKYGSILILSWVVFTYFREKKPLSILGTASIAGLLMFSTGVVHIFLSGFYAYDLFMTSFESVVVFVFVYILSYALPIVVQRTKRKKLSNEELICIAISTAIAITGLADVAIAGYALKNMLGILLTLIFSYLGGASIGASVGITIGIITSMSTIGTPTVIGIYGFSGLLAGIFKDLGKFGSAVGIILGNTILTFYINGSTEVILQFEEILAAILLFLIMPKGMMQYIEKFANGGVGAMEWDKSYSERIRQINYERLREYANAFSELASTYDQVSVKERMIDQQELASIVDQVVNKVCSQCGMCRSCWKNGFYDTYNGIVDVISQLEATGTIPQDKIPQSLKKRCIRIEPLLQAIRDIFELYKIHYKWERKLFDSRQLLAEQFRGVSEIFYELISEITEDLTFRTEIEDAIYVAFDKAGMAVEKVTVMERSSGKFEIDIERRACYDRKQCDDKVAPMVSRVIGREVIRQNHRCTSLQDSNNCLFKLVEAEKYKIATGVARISKDNRYICGDNYSFSQLKDGMYMVALSDGMGSGEKAAKESLTTITLLEQLLEAGFNRELAIRTINSILVSKSSEEIFSTIDLSIVDLYSGKLEFIKIGAAPSFIKRANGEVEIIKSTSLPVGILNNVDIESFGKRLNNGDLIVILSDGVLDADKNMDEKENWILAALRSFDSKNPQFIADELLNLAISKYGNRIEDDMTVLVSKIWESK
ncbi:stage II sporulation protein E [Geosporobacter ferrireducens]|uniref:Stage II sporulation protein E n=1 Tax=Geosporobacter ferrireducens TaxID=1424294 RepID=A0A1D8GJH3_9FIRM|nr:stage II sporulation protein E [Geosporobacter ferrireducens]AOT71071.1 stage II sporulation protein E [Geosporobacter ferrireducens]MTI58298.1 stage II sporulation protein E [Geosporobacter ferrireducens]